MIKAFSMMKRRDDMSVAEFRRWLLEDHIGLGKKIPGLRAYKVNLPLDESGNAPFDAVSELIFDSAEARDTAFATPEGKAAGADAAAHCSSRTPLVTAEHVIF
jgi:uncharacterized protein (TIGR02118 family)